jgi:hypothetical protein
MIKQRTTGDWGPTKDLPPIDDETRAAIEEGVEQARRREFVPDEEIEALWKRYSP